jgi:predicted cation transporter
VATIVYAYYLRTKILKDTKVDGPLTNQELIGVLITLVINVLISGSIYYFSLYKKLPKKAKDINKYVILILIIVLILQYGLHLPIFLTTR